MSLPELATGTYPDVDETEYHLDQRAISQTDMKLILEAPAKLLWKMEHPPKSKPEFEFGKAAHKLILDVGPRLVIFDYDPGKVKAPKNTNAWKSAYAEAEANGDVLLLPSEYEKVQAMAKQVRNHRAAMQLLSEGQPEVTAYAQDTVTGVWVRGRFDWLGDRILSDYKTSTTAAPDAFVKKAVDYGYDLQAGTYLDLAAACGHPAEGFAHIVQEKEPPYLVTVIVLPADLIERGRALKHRALERYRDCVEAAAWPGYVPDDQIATPAAPAWALKELETYQ